MSWEGFADQSRIAAERKKGYGQTTGGRENVQTGSHLAAVGAGLAVRGVQRLRKCGQLRLVLGQDLGACTRKNWHALSREACVQLQSAATYLSQPWQAGLH